MTLDKLKEFVLNLNIVALGLQSIGSIHRSP